jgi:hypothetical protein
MLLHEEDQHDGERGQITVTHEPSTYQRCIRLCSLVSLCFVRACLCASLHLACVHTTLACGNFDAHMRYAHCTSDIDVCICYVIMC